MASSQHLFTTLCRRRFGLHHLSLAPIQQAVSSRSVIFGVDEKLLPVFLSRVRNGLGYGMPHERFYFSCNKDRYNELGVWPARFLTTVKVADDVDKSKEHSEPLSLAATDDVQGEPLSLVATDDDADGEPLGLVATDHADGEPLSLSATEEAAEIGYKVVGRIKSGEVGRIKPPKAFAVVQVGSHQFKISPGDSIYTEKLKYADVNDKLCLEKVLLLGSKSQTIIGRPVIPKAAVHAVVEEHALDAKVIIFKKKRRKNYRRTRGHRQELTRLRILDIRGLGEARSAII